MKSGLHTSLFALLIVCAGTHYTSHDTARADSVNWVHFLKLRPWSFDADDIRYPNHANIPTEQIRELVAADDPQVAPSKRMIIAAKAVGAKPRLHPEQRAVLLRDAFNLISDLHVTWNAYDYSIPGEAVLFFGRSFGEAERVALAISLRDGKMYRGVVVCEQMLCPGWTPRFDDPDEWRLVQ